MNLMNHHLKAKIHESLAAVLPVTMIVLILSMTVTPMSLSTLMMFLTGAVMLIVGMGFFTLGADMAMMPIGEAMGSQITKFKKLPTIVIACFLIGMIVTIAEPDLKVLAGQTPGVPDMVLILAVAAGVGAFLAVSFLKTFFRWKLQYILLICYALVFGFSVFVPREFLAVAFDSGGVTTGPITVPFIMTLGLGLASVSKGEDESDSFGLTIQPEKELVLILVPAQDKQAIMQSICTAFRKEIGEALPAFSLPVDGVTGITGD